MVRFTGVLDGVGVQAAGEQSLVAICVFRTRQAKVWWTESRMWKALKGNTNPWEYRLGSLQQCMGPRRTRQRSNALKSRPLRGERFFFRKSTQRAGGNGKRAKEQK